jgi:hypothetical protein
MAGNLPNIANIYAAEPLASGTIFSGPLTVTAPIDADTPVLTVSPEWIDLGYVSADGFMEKNDRKIEFKRSFGGGIVKVLQSEYSASIELTFLESLNAFVLMAIFGSANVQVIAATHTHGNQVVVQKNQIKLPHLSYLIDTFDDELNAKYRNYIPVGQITNIAEIKIVHTDTIEYKTTIEALPDANQNNIYTFTDDGQIVEGS